MIKKRVFKIIAEASLIGIAITIPFWMILNNIAIVFGLFACTCCLFKCKNYNRAWFSIYSVYIFLYALMIISLLYTDNFKIGFQKLEQRLVFLIIPIICFSFTQFITPVLIKKVLKYFTYSVLIAILIFLTTAVKKTLYFASSNPFNEANGNFFSYMEFTKVIEDTHPIYFGTNVLFSIFILGYDYFNNTIIFKINALFRLFLLLLLTTITFLLNSFLLIVILLVIFIYFSYLLVNKNSLNTFKKIIVVFLTLATMLFSSSFIYNKFKGLDLRNDLLSRDFSGTQFTAVKARVAKLYCSIELISDNFWLGVGPGDEKKELLKYYSKNNFNHGVKQRFNSHNQYVTEFIYTGVLGFIGILVLFFVIFWRGFSTQNAYLIILGLIFCIFNLTESALVRNKGIVFLVFFSCFLFSLNKHNQVLKP